MKNLKKNNKGFSLVELIVVVLIIAIIAVALAPQVIKWVGEATKNTEKNNKATIQAAIQTCTAEFIAKGGKINANATVTVEEEDATVQNTTNAPDGTTLESLIEAAIKGNTDSTTYTYNLGAGGDVKSSN